MFSVRSVAVPRPSLALLLCVLAGCGGGSSPSVPAAAGGGSAGGGGQQDSRAFGMALHPLLHDWSADPDQMAQITKDTYTRVAEHAEIFAHQISDGVPWVEVAAGQPFSPEVEAALDVRTSLSTGGIYLGVTPLNGSRDGLAPYWGSGVVPPEWQDPAFDDPLVVSTYIEYCRLMIGRFDPLAFAFAIEPNMIALADKAPDQYPALLSLLQQTRAALAAEFPDLPMFVTLQVDYTTVDSAQWDVLDDLLPLCDDVAISTYPWFIPVLVGAAEPGAVPADWFQRFADLAPGKPVVVTETAAAAMPLDLPALGLAVSASVSDQLFYTDFLMSEAQRLEMPFVGWLTLHDLDGFLDSFTDITPEALQTLSIFKDMGLVDELDLPRPALAIWDGWFAREYAPAN